MKFVEKYNLLKEKYNIINEGTYNTILPIIQQVLIDKHFIDKKSYTDLNDEEKILLYGVLDKAKQTIETLVNYITTNNKQYASWFYGILTIGPRSYMNVGWLLQFSESDSKALINSVFKKYFDDYAVICRSPKIEKEYKNIMRFTTWPEFREFVKSKSAFVIKSTKLDFELAYKNSKFDIYKVTMDDKDDFQQTYGTEGYNCGWCVINPEKTMFEHYLEGDRKSENPCYYLWTYTGTSKPFALMHIRTGQFKDIHNNPLEDISPEVIDGLKYLIGNDVDFVAGLTDRDDMYIYRSHIISNISLGRQFAAVWGRIYDGVTYDEKTNTVNCNKQPVAFSDQFLKDGTFDFKLINLPTDLSHFFNECESLIHLPEDFTIPEGTTRCDHMFYFCSKLEKLPENFNIPDTVTNVKYMFYGCKSLTYLPEKFNLYSYLFVPDDDMLPRVESMFFGTHITDQELSRVLTNPQALDYKDIIIRAMKNI